MIGSTVFGTTGKNLFLNQETRKYSPCLRLNIALRPGGKGEKMLNHLLVRKVALLMDALVVYKHNPELKDKLDCAKVIIPENYRICGTCFTAFTLLGDSSKSGFVHIHKDNRDTLWIILSLDNNVDGGDIQTRSISNQTLSQSVSWRSSLDRATWYFLFYLNKQILKKYKNYRHKAWFENTIITTQR